MHLVGSAFCCEVPDDWREAREPGCVIATAPTSSLGFTPNVVLRESVIEERPDALAAISQANLRSTTELPGTLVIQVEAPRRHGVEHRRIWMLTPAAPEELHGNILSLLSIQDLTITNGVIAELTLTLPLLDWMPNDHHQRILDSLQVMPHAEQQTPPTAASIPEVTLDAWATNRDGAPREDLGVVTPPHLVLQAEPLVLSTTATSTFLTHAGQRIFTPVTGRIKDELATAGLVEQDGTPSPAGYWYIDHLLTGKGWAVTVAAPTPRQFQFWITDATTILTTVNPDQEGTSLLAYCPSNDLFRILLGWIEATPAWPMDIHLELNGQQLQDKLEHDQVTFASSGDAAEFVNQPWTLLSLKNSDGQTHLNWIHTPTRGEATTWYDPSLRNSSDLLTIDRPGDGMFWLSLARIITENS